MAEYINGTEYIDRKELVDNINRLVKLTNKDEQEWVKDECIRQAYCLMKADVVPRSEYEELQKRLNDYKKFVGEIRVTSENHAVIIESENTEYIDKRVAEGLKNIAVKKAKQEVAREILGNIHREIELALLSNYKAKQERIDKHYNGMSDVIDDFISLVDGKIQALRGIDDFIEELEKKYIGG